jgi:ligand-binding sensor domain-containing protein
MTKLLLSIVFFLLSIYITTAQSNVQFERYTIENGLSSNKVSQVYQDSKGFIWVATRDGLNRYDGYHFQVFKNNPQDATSLPDNFVQHLFEDKNGTLWIGTEKGLSYYDHAQQCFFNIQVGKKKCPKIY